MEEILLVNAPETLKEIFMGQATWTDAAGGALGAAATLIIPKMLKQEGWYGVAISGVAAFLGGFTIKQFNYELGQAFVITGAGITLIKAIKELLGLPTLFAGLKSPFAQTGPTTEYDTQLFDTPGHSDIDGFGQEVVTAFDALDTFEDDLVPTFTDAGRVPA